MEIFRLHAYKVMPQRTADEFTPSDGGAVRPTADLKSVMESNLQDARFSERPTIDFNVDEISRTNQVRNAVMSFAFGEGATARAAALLLAEKLALAMDRRSTPCLFVPSAYRANGLRRVILWTFPRDEAFQLRSGPDGPEIQLLHEVFSQTSRHRKGALFEGKNLRTEFLGGRVLDHQADSAAREIADFWIARFLDCILSMHDKAGSRMLARALRQTSQRIEEPLQRQQLYAALTAVRHSPRRRISLVTFADRYLEEPARSVFLAAAPNDQSRYALFNFDRDAFDDMLQFRVFELQSGVFVSSPIDQIGEAVKIEAGEETRLVCEGVVKTESLRSRHA